MNRDWIATIPSWPESFTYRSMIDTAKELSQELRDPKGEHQVDMIIALTHCRVPNVSLVTYMKHS
jgi:5'-nucleotidase